MRVLIDTNVLLDALLPDREGKQAATVILDAVSQRHFIGLVTPMTMGTVFHYVQHGMPALLRKKGMDERVVKAMLNDLIEQLTFLPSPSGAFSSALVSSFRDWEDGAQFFSASGSGGLHAIVTNDVKDFKEHVNVPVWTPAQLVARLNEIDKK